MGNCKSIYRSTGTTNQQKLSENQNTQSSSKPNQPLPEQLPEQLPDDLNVRKLAAFIPPITSGKVVKVYDGDTITIASRIPGLTDSIIYKFSVRLNGIDTPEMKTKNQEEKEIAQLAQKAVSDMIMGKTISLRNVKTEKYGRLLANVYIQVETKEIHLNDWLIENRYAVHYDGGTKICPKSWKAYLEGTEKIGQIRCIL